MTVGWVLAATEPTSWTDFAQRLPGRFVAQVAVTPGCWLWTGHLGRGGYGRYQYAKGRAKYAHRMAYEALVGPVPPGMVLDHVKARGCASRACVNPAHLEVVTQQVNVLRGDGFAARQAAQTHCVNGHDLADAYRRKNGGRNCRTCALERARGVR